MKINVSVELDWIEEDGSIDEEVKAELIGGIKRSISQQCLAKVEKEASVKIDEAIQQAIQQATKSIQQKAVEFADEWLENEVEITDKWGDVKKKATIKDVIKSTFDHTLEKKVNENGEFADGYGRSGNTTLISWLTGKKVENVVADKLATLNKDIDNQITKAVNAGIRKNVSDKFAEMVVATAHHDNKAKQLEHGQ